MSFYDLPTEIHEQISHSLSSIQDVLSLGLTCHRLHGVVTRPVKRLPILFSAAEHAFGPLSSAMALCTHNSAQPPHIPRPSPPESFPLLRQLLHVGSVANAWADLYPFIHWSSTTDNPEDSASRRLLTERERYRARRACYRIWLYALAYHQSSFPRHSRYHVGSMGLRASLLRAWTTVELKEIQDLQGIMRKLVELHICPTTTTVIRHYKDRYGEDSMPAFNSHIRGQSKSYRVTQQQLEYWDGWGDSIHQYYVVEDMLKLHPGQIMELYNFVNRCETGPAFLDGVPSTGSNKMDVESYVDRLGEWFETNGQTLGETVKLVESERGNEETDGVGAIVADG
ncbi:MAG: hypothetical protein Q9188_006634 [Gyalolechia gomerana]